MAKTIELFISETKRQPWGWETLIAHTPQYTGKVLLYRAGMAGGLQYHVEKDETFLLHEGQGWIDYDGGDGKLTRRRMSAGESYHVPPGAVHRFEAVTDCIVFEASTPHFEDRVRCEAVYGEPEVGGLPTTWPRSEGGTP